MLMLPLCALLAFAQSDDLRPVAPRSTVLSTASRQSWAKGLKQIPSTVIDVGVLKNVPYTSYRAGDIEVNVYGDPLKPAGVEIGLHGALLKSDEAKKSALAFINALLADADRAALATLQLQTGKTTRAGLTFEITPPDAPDAYGGWWISVYNEKLLDASRASEEEMKKITASRADVKNTRPPVTGSGAAVEGAAAGKWSAEDLAAARTRKDVAEEKQKVYAPAITKKDGKYVPDRTIDDTGYILFICANSSTHEDKEVLLKTCAACAKESTFFWDDAKKGFVCFQCGGDVDNARIKCPDCGAVPRRVRTKHK
jgi:hypothetical protein